MNVRVLILSAVLVCLGLAIAASILLHSPESGVLSSDPGVRVDDGRGLPGDDPLPTEVADDRVQEQTAQEEVTARTVSRMER